MILRLTEQKEGGQLKKWLGLLIVSMSLTILGACENTPGEASDGADEEVGDSASGTRLADELAITRASMDQVAGEVKESSDVADASISLEGDTLSIILTAGQSLTDGKTKVLAEQILRSISEKTVGSTATEESYGAVFNIHHVSILVENEEGSILAEAKMMAGTHSLEW